MSNYVFRCRHSKPVYLVTQVLRLQLKFQDPPMVSIYLGNLHPPLVEKLLNTRSVWQSRAISLLRWVIFFPEKLLAFIFIFLWATLLNMNQSPTLRISSSKSHMKNKSQNGKSGNQLLNKIYMFTNNIGEFGKNTCDFIFCYVIAVPLKFGKRL